MLVPKQFTGTEQQKESNYSTHHFNPEDGRCIRCDSKMWHKAAEYPCGQEPEMIEVSQEDYVAENPVMGKFFEALGVKND
jgi:hypothetical protein